MESGAVKTWLEDRGFGFITADSDGKDLFVHVKSLPRGTKSLAVGDRVDFERQQTQRGMQAVNVMFAQAMESELPQVWVLTEDQFRWELDQLSTSGRMHEDGLLGLAREHGWVS